MSETMTLTLSRTTICNIRLALLHVAQDFRREAADPETTDDRREIAERSAEHWERIREEVIRQFNEQDPYKN